MFYVYILKSLKDNGFYIGQSRNLERRLKEHNNGFVSSTKNRRPLVLVKTMFAESCEEALILEKEYKKGYKREELKREFE
ncbi:MAG: GIY-YIG nuclease family protein [Patescibacteria group bacterium]